MSIGKGLDKSRILDLPQISTRCSFLYLERCVVHREDGALTVTDVRGVVHVPVASLCVVMLGPGTKITHRAVELISDSGVSLLWVGEQGVKYYAYGKSLTHSSKLLLKQAQLVTNVQQRASVVRKMYSMRFNETDIGNLTIQQLRGREGTRMREMYKEFARKTGVEWTGRVYDTENYRKSNEINQALSVANTCLYGLVHSVIMALGLSPGLGFVHTGHELSFVYDVADLYKAEITIPTAFKVVSENKDIEDVAGEVRRAVRDVIKETKLLSRVVHDLQYLLGVEDVDIVNADILYLWDDKVGKVASGVSYTYADDIEDEGNGVVI